MLQRGMMLTDGRPLAQRLSRLDRPDHIQCRRRPNEDPLEMKEVIHHRNRFGVRDLQRARVHVNKCQVVVRAVKRSHARVVKNHLPCDKALRHSYKTT